MDFKNFIRRIISKIPITLIKNGTVLIFFIFIYGTIGSHFLMGLSIFDSIYYTITTMATVGYGDIIPNTIVEKLFSMTLALGGVGVIAYVFTIVLTNFSEKMSEVSRGAKMKKKIEKMKDPYILCGYGRVGKVVLNELEKRNQSVIVIEKNKDVIENIESSDSVLVIHGDATDNELLKELMLDKAESIIITSGSDVTNLYIVLSVRELSPESWIVTRSSKPENIQRLYNAGANKIVSPEISGGNDLYFAAAKPHLLRITVQHGINQIVEEIETVTSFGCTLENIAYHFPGIDSPLTRKIGVVTQEDIKNFNEKMLFDEEKRKSLENLYNSVENIHSHCISGPNKETLTKLAKHLEKQEKIIGLNLNNEEISEITKKYVKNICSIKLE